MLSPNPGVSTTVNAILIPSSSSSGVEQLSKMRLDREINTNGSWFNPDRLLHICGLRRVVLLVLQHVCFAEGVDEGYTACAVCPCTPGGKPRLLSTPRCTQ